MKPRLLPLLVCLGLLAVLLASCGGGGSSQETTVQRAAPAAIARADSICHQLRREILGLAKGALAHPPETTLELTTERLVRPSIPLLKRVADRMQSLEPEAHSKAFNLYANIFDPFLVLTEKRLQAGLEGDASRSHGLEEQLTDLSVVQRHAAQLAGIHECDVDFPRLLINSLSE